MIRVQLVLVDGVLRGKTASDRWNLLQLIGVSSIPDDRNGAALKRVRRAILKEFGEGFALTKVRGGRPVSATAKEIAALGEANVARLSSAA